MLMYLLLDDSIFFIISHSVTGRAGADDTQERSMTVSL